MSESFLGLPRKHNINEKVPYASTVGSLNFRAEPRRGDKNPLLVTLKQINKIISLRKRSRYLILLKKAMGREDLFIREDTKSGKEHSAGCIR